MIDSNTITWSTVVDDAIKIGGSAIIGGFGAIVIAVYNHRKTRDFDYSKRRTDLLVKIGSDFAISSYRLTELSGKLIDLVFTSEISPSGQALKKSLQSVLTPGNSELEPLLESFSVIMSLARIANHPEIADAVEDYRKACNISNSQILEAMRQKETGAAPRDSREKLEQLLTNQYIVSQKVLAFTAQGFQAD
jgi:hypothetical protein